ETPHLSGPLAAERKDAGAPRPALRRRQARPSAGRPRRDPALATVPRRRGPRAGRRRPRLGQTQSPRAHAYRQRISRRACGEKLGAASAPPEPGLGRAPPRRLAPAFRLMIFPSAALWIWDDSDPATVE